MLASEDRAILDFERAWWKEPGPKDQAIEFSLGLTAAAYYGRLLELIADPLALRYDPLTVKRIRSFITETASAEMVI